MSIRWTLRYVLVVAIVCAVLMLFAAHIWGFDCYYECRFAWPDLSAI